MPNIISTAVGDTLVADLYGPVESLSVVATSVAAIAPEITGEVTTNRDLPTQPCTATIGTTDLTKIKNLTREEEGAKFVANQGSWDSVRKKWRFLTEKMRELEKMSLSESEINTLTNVKGRWENVDKYNNPADLIGADLENFNTFVADFEQSVEYDKSELADLKKTKAKRYEDLEGDVYKFHTFFISFKEQYTDYIEEIGQINRFDDLYNHADTLKYLSWIQSVRFTTAELKALHCQECGDFCVTSVAGLSTKTVGIKNKKTENPSFTGIGQMGGGAIIESRKWLQKRYKELNKGSTDNNIMIAIANFDAGKVQECIWLSIGYLGYIADSVLYNDLPLPFPDCIEFKKFLFIAYNYGAKNITTAAKKCTNGKSYVWSDVLPTLLDIVREDPDKGKIKEVPYYVPKILYRLGVNIP